MPSGSASHLDPPPGLGSGAQDCEAPACLWLGTFNCGIGYCVVVPADQVAQAIDVLTGAGEQVFELGRIHAREHATDDAVRLV